MPLDNLVPNFTYVQDQPLYTGNAVEETKQALTALDKKHWENKNTNDAMQIAYNNMAVYPEGEAQKEEALKALEKAKPFIQNNNWEEATAINGDIAKEISTHKGFMQALKNKSAGDKANAEADAIRAKGGVPLIFENGTTKESFKPDGTLNEYRPTAVIRPEYHKTIEEIVDKIKADTTAIGPGWTQDDTDLLKAGTIEKIDTPKLVKLFNAVKKQFDESNEGNIFYREANEIKKSKNANKDAEDLIWAAMSTRVYNKENPDNSFYLKQMEINEARAKAAAAAKKEEESKYKLTTSTPLPEQVKGIEQATYGDIITSIDLSKEQLNTAEINFNSVRDLYKLPNSIHIEDFDPENSFKYAGDIKDLQGHGDELMLAVSKYYSAKHILDGIEATKQDVLNSTGITFDPKVEQQVAEYASRKVQEFRQSNSEIGLLGSQPDVPKKVKENVERTLYAKVYNEYLKTTHTLETEKLNTEVAERHKNYKQVNNVIRFSENKDNESFEKYVDDSFVASASNTDNSTTLPKFVSMEGEGGKLGELGQKEIEKWSRGTTSFIGVAPDKDSSTGYSIYFRKIQKDDKAIVSSPIMKLDVGQEKYHEVLTHKLRGADKAARFEQFVTTANNNKNKQYVDADDYKRQNDEQYKIQDPLGDANDFETLVKLKFGLGFNDPLDKDQRKLARDLRPRISVETSTSGKNSEYTVYIPIPIWKKDNNGNVIYENGEPVVDHYTRVNKVFSDMQAAYQEYEGYIQKVINAVGKK